MVGLFVIVRQQKGMGMSLVSLTPGKRVLLRPGEGVVSVQFTCRSTCKMALVGMYELADGTTGVVQLWPELSLGDLDKPPFILFRNTLFLDPSNSFTEKSLEFRLEYASNLRRLVVFATACSDGDTWRMVQSSAVTVVHARQTFDFQPDLLRFGLPNLRRFFCRSCVLVTLEFDKKGHVALTPQGTFFTGTHQQIATAYDLNLNFTSSSTS